MVKERDELKKVMINPRFDAWSSLSVAHSHVLTPSVKKCSPLFPKEIHPKSLVIFYQVLIEIRIPYSSDKTNDLFDQVNRIRKKQITYFISLSFPSVVIPPGISCLKTKNSCSPYSPEFIINYTSKACS